jgi:L-histidine N-alpha-methyltransferase
MCWPASGPSPADGGATPARPDAAFARLAVDVRRGLCGRPRRLPPKYFYDAVGAALFEQITRLPEYYLTRAEETILADVAGTLIRRLDPAEIVELGPGSCRKVRPLLDAVDHCGGVRYVAVDVGADTLAGATGALARDYPALDVRPVVGDFEHDLDRVPPPVGRRLVLFLGSTIGNFDPPARRRLLGRIRRLLGPGGRLLVGVDLVKDRAALEAAYNDAAGVTAAFNRNVLRVVNRGVDGDFRPEAFRHHAFYNEAASRIEMHLVATVAQRVRLARLGLELFFEEGGGIWTESSYKFTRASAAAMLAEAGLAGDGWFTDPGDRFALLLARVHGT